MTMAMSEPGKVGARMGMVASKKAMDMCIEKAHKYGMGMVVVRNSGNIYSVHFNNGRGIAFIEKSKPNKTKSWRYL